MIARTGNMAGHWVDGLFNPRIARRLARISGIVTSAVGWDLSTTVNVPVVPSSLVLFDIVPTRKPETSLSVIVTDAVSGVFTEYVGAFGVSVTITVSSGSSSASSFTVTVMVADGWPPGIVTVPGSAV